MANEFEIANFNLVEHAKRYWDLTGNPTPMMVEVPQKNANGDIVNYSTPNRAMIKKQMWDDVGGALGQFKKTYWVDKVDGDDNNIGSEHSPFKTIKKACDAVPLGGYGRIILTRDNNILDNTIYLINKTIEITGAYIDSASTLPAILNTCFLRSEKNETTGFVMINSYLSLSNLTIKTADFIDAGKNLGYYEGFIKRSNSESKNKIVVKESSILIGDTDFLRVSNRQDVDIQIYYRDTTHNVTNISIDVVGQNRNGLLVNNEYGTVIFNASRIAFGTKNDNSTALGFPDLVNNIIKDTNGIPRNILSNIVF